MDLYLLRHADAETKAATDDGRRLSEKGIGQAHRVARFCKAREIAPELILTSPVRRAAETALIVANELATTLIDARWIACGMQPETAVDELRAYAEFKSVLLVGHQPDLSMLAANLLGLSDAERLYLRKASLMHLDCPLLAPGAACLQWFVPCRLM